MKQTHGPMITLTDTNTTTTQMLTSEMKSHLQQLKCWQRDQTWTEEVMHGLAANSGADQSRLFFEQVMYTVRNVAPENLVPFMNTYVRGLKNGIHIEDSLEYAVLFQQADLLKEMLDRYAENGFCDEWVQVYHFLLDGMEGKLPCEELLQQSKDLSNAVHDPILRLRLALVEVVACSNLGHTDRSTELLHDLEQQVSTMELGFMKSAFLSRISIEMSNLLLYVEADVTKAERKLIEVISNNATPYVMLVSSRHSLGLATLCKQKELCLNHFKKAIFYAEYVGTGDYHKELITSYYPFARNIHGEHFDIKDVVPEERIHQYIVRGEQEKALQLADQLEAGGKGNAFLTFYRGKATGNKQLLHQAREKFKKDHYGYMLPLVEQELIKEEEMRK